MFKKGNHPKTEWKKGNIPWNKNKKMPYTEARRKYDERQRGKTKPKPKNFSEIMRKVNPPKGRKIFTSGYVVVYKPKHPNSGKDGYILEHWYIMSRHIGRPLKSPECIHHLDGDKANNKLSNLVLCKDAKEHNAIHHTMGQFVEELIKSGKVKYDRKRKRFYFR